MTRITGKTRILFILGDPAAPPRLSHRAHPRPPAGVRAARDLSVEADADRPRRPPICEPGMGLATLPPGPDVPPAVPKRTTFGAHFKAIARPVIVCMIYHLWSKEDVMTASPHPLRIAAAWKGSDFDFKARALRVLDKAQIDEIDAGLAVFEQKNRTDLLEISPDTFPLPTVGSWMAALKYDLRFGPGLILLRGLPRERYTADQISKIYFALGTHLGKAVPQSYHGELLGSVIDVSDADATVRGYQAGGRQGFHTDGTACDIVGLMCLQSAKSGGQSRVVSAVAVHNALVDTRPELAKVFYDGFTYRKTEKDALHAGTAPTSKHPVQVFAQHEGEFFCNLNGGDIRRAIEFGDSELSDLQIEAYDEFQRIANSEEFYLDMSIDEGDIQYVNNRTLLHGRLGYEDNDEIARRRYMLRLWLELPEWPARPHRQVVIDFATARRWMANRVPSLELPSNFVAAKQSELNAIKGAGAKPARMKPYENLSMKQFVETATRAG